MKIKKKKEREKERKKERKEERKKERRPILTEKKNITKGYTHSEICPKFKI